MIWQQRSGPSWYVDDKTKQEEHIVLLLRATVKESNTKKICLIV